MSRYYISNNIRFIQGYGNLMESPSSATRFTRSDAMQYLRLHPDHVLMPYGNAKKRSAFIISTKQQYIGNNKDIVNSISDARSFSSPSDAYAFIDKNNKFVSALDEVCVIDENYKRIKRPDAPQQKASSVNKPRASARRSCLKQRTKKAVIKRGSVCPICGLPINDGDATVDHIIPLSRGGTNSIDNLRSIHASCNQLKGSFLDNELFDNVSNVASNMLYHSPTSDISMRLIRSIVRGTLAQYKLKDGSDVVQGNLDGKYGTIKPQPCTGKISA